MWVIEGSGYHFYLLPNRIYYVGRKDGEIRIDHPSVSRTNHASVQLSFLMSFMTDKTKHGTVTFTSLSNAITQIGGKRLDCKESITVQNDASLVFGDPKASTFTLKYVPIIVAHSCLTKQLKNELTGLLRQLGGHAVRNWDDDCTHLAVDQLAVTIKTISALVSQKPIVRVEYFKDLVNLCGSNGQGELSVAKYLPTDVEEQLRHLDVDYGHVPARKSLFQNIRVFFFSDKQRKRMEEPIALAGGSTLIISEMTIVSSLMKPGTIVMQTVTNENDSVGSSGWVCEVQQAISRSGKRMILDKEIGLAILLCSRDQYCNPDAPNPFGELFSSPVASQPKKKPAPLVVETQTPLAVTPLAENITICVPDSASPSPNFTAQSVEHLPVQQVVEETPIKSVPVASSVNEKVDEPALKRKLVDEISPDMEPSSTKKVKRKKPPPARSSTRKKSSNLTQLSITHFSQHCSVVPSTPPAEVPKTTHRDNLVNFSFHQNNPPSADVMDVIVDDNAATPDIGIPLDKDQIDVKPVISESQQMSTVDEEPPTASNLIVVQFDNLIRPPRRRAPLACSEDDGFVMWNGRRVQNFKRFRKQKINSKGKDFISTNISLPSRGNRSAFEDGPIQNIRPIAPASMVRERVTVVDNRRSSRRSTVVSAPEKTTSKIGSMFDF